MRTSSLLAGYTAAALVSVACCPSAFGQWALTTEVGADRFWGGSIENTAEHRSFRPYRPTTFGVGLERRAGRLGAGLRLRYASAGLALEGEDAVVAAKGVFAVYSAAPELVYRIISVGAANQLRLHLGPLFEIWSVVDGDSQTRVGVQGAVSLNLPLGGRFAGSLMAGAALIPSPFEEAQLDPSFERRALWRRRVAVGLDYRL
ncbi:MAG: hypothetical protein QOH59_669 [Gemmatimonadales bacterium]|nr:hypothetical protein [Gemmatimonadales bacterium]